MNSKNLLFYLGVFAVTWLAWVFLVHEPSHAAVCLLSGNEYTFTMNFFFPSVSCSGLNESSEMVKFLFYMIPYLVGIAVIISSFLLNKVRGLKWYIRLPAHVAMFDMITNYLGAAVILFSDFIGIAVRASSFYWLAVLLVACAGIIWAVGFGDDIKKIFSFKKGEL